MTTTPRDTGSNLAIENRLAQIEKQLANVASLATAQRNELLVSHINTDSDEVNLLELWNIIWKGKWFIISVAFLFGVVSIFYALAMPNLYRSEALLAPSEENSGGGLASLTAQFGGLASFAGVNLGGRGSDKTALALEILKSREFISHFIQKHDLMVPLMAADGWNREKDELTLDSDIYDVAEKKWVRNVAFPYQPTPSALEAYEQFNEFLKVSQSKDTNFISLGFEFYSPNVAKQWVDWLVNDINAAVKARDVDEAQRSIKYLTAQLEKISIAGMQAIFYELIEEQTKTVMFAEVRDEYVFKTIDKAVSAEIKIKPRRGIIVLLGVIFGSILSTFAVFTKHFFTEKSRDKVK